MAVGSSVPHNVETWLSHNDLELQVGGKLIVRGNRRNGGSDILSVLNQAGTEVYKVGNSGTITLSGNITFPTAATISTTTGTLTLQTVATANLNVTAGDEVRITGGRTRLVSGAFCLNTTVGAAADILDNATIPVDQAARRYAPAGNRTGLIMSPASGDFSFMVVYNNSAFTMTFAAVGTSHVANGTGCVIAANTAKAFVGDGGSGNWWPIG